ncbi:MAG: hypothetical protein GXO29_04195 [Thermotogae bacterium]|nr:hypothetical protein [Thermotogota bacterium]
MRRILPLLMLLGCGNPLLKSWEEKAKRDPVAVLEEIGDSLNSTAFRKKMSLTPLGPKVSNFVGELLLNLNYDALSLESLLRVADALKSYMQFLYDYGLFDERWERAVFSYREVLRAVKRRVASVEDLDSLAHITRRLKPPITARAYKKEYESLIEMYRRRSLQEGDIRWGMREEDVIALWGEPESVDTVLSVAGSSFGKLLNYGDRQVLIIDGKVEDVFEK